MAKFCFLPADAVKSAFDSKLNRERYWINIRENEYEEFALDPRYSKPSKTKDSIRQIPLNETTARIIELYSEDFRGRPRHSFLLNSQVDLPLSTEALTKAFRTVSARSLKALLKNSRQGLVRQSLPHTICAIRARLYASINC